MAKVLKSNEYRWNWTYTVHQLAKNNQCSYWAMMNWLKDNDVPVIKIGGTAHVFGMHLLTTLAACGMPTAEIGNRMARNVVEILMSSTMHGT